MLNDTRGGVEPRDVTDVAVKPIGSSASVDEVMIATPEACIRKVVLSASEPVTGNLESIVVISR